MGGITRIETLYIGRMTVLRSVTPAHRHLSARHEPSGTVMRTDYQIRELPAPNGQYDIVSLSAIEAPIVHL